MFERSKNIKFGDYIEYHNKHYVVYNVDEIHGLLYVYGLGISELGHKVIITSNTFGLNNEEVHYVDPSVIDETAELAIIRNYLLDGNQAYIDQLFYSPANF